MAERKDGPINLYDPVTTQVVTLDTTTVGDFMKNNPGYLKSVPPLFSGDRPVYHPDSEVHSLTYAAIKRAQSAARSNGFSGTDLTGLDQAYLYAGAQAPHRVADALRYLADDISSQNGDLRQSMALASLASALDQKATPHRQIEQTNDPAWKPEQDLQELLLPTMEQTVLSTGQTFGERRENKSREHANKMVNEARRRVATPFPKVVDEISSSLTANLNAKQKRLASATEAEDRRNLTAEITAIQANAEYCAIFNQLGVDYNSFADIAQTLKARLQDEIEKRATDNPDFTTKLADDQIDVLETKLDAITSLEGQFKEAKRKRDLAVVFFQGDQEKGKEGMLREAEFSRKKRLSETLDASGTPLINVEAARRTASWLNGELFTQVFDTSPKTLCAVVTEYWGDDLVFRECLAELAQADPAFDLTKVTFQDFIAKAYSTSSVDSRVEDRKAEAMRFLIPALEQATGLDIRANYAGHMDQYSREVDDQDFIDAVNNAEQARSVDQLTQQLTTVLNVLSIPVAERTEFVRTHQSDLNAILLANYEVTDLAYDNHLNPNALLENIAQAKLNNDPMVLQIVRCLRWCYPNRQLAFTPTGGDFMTQDVDGLPIPRRESVEQEKLNRFNKGVVAPIKHHDIPIKSVRLLCTGDFELIGEGYNLTEDDEQVQDARLYALDQLERVPTWGTFGEIPVEVVPFRGFTVADKLSLLKKQVASVIDTHGQETYEMIIREAKRDPRILDFWFSDPDNNLSSKPIKMEGVIDKFDSEHFQILWDLTKAEYDKLQHDNSANFCGYTASSIERIIDQEHEHRQPFVEGWTRKHSRDYTRHYLTFGIALGVVLAAEPSPKLMTVSGNQYAARHFSHGHRIDTVPPLPITLYQSINDGTQSELYKQMSEVVS